MIGKAIFDRLANDTDVKAIVSDRIYPSVSPDNMYPLIVYDAELEGGNTLGNDLELNEYTLTLTLVTTSYATLQQLGNAVLAALDGQGGTWAGIFVRGCYLQSASEDSFTDSANSEITYRTAEQVFRVWAKT